MAFSSGLDRLVQYLGGIGSRGHRADRDLAAQRRADRGGRQRPQLPLVAADVGKAVSARIAYTGAGLSQFEMISGGPLTAFTTNKIQAKRIPSGAFVRLVRATISAIGTR